MSVTILDESVVFVALPAIERELRIGLSGQQWVRVRRQSADDSDGSPARS